MAQLPELLVPSPPMARPGQGAKCKPRAHADCQPFGDLSQLYPVGNEERLQA